MGLPSDINPAKITVFHGNPLVSPVPIYKAPPEGPKAITIPIRWFDYGPTTGIPIIVDLAAQRITAQQFSQIAALFIDNTQNLNACGVYFEDTQTVIEVPAQSSGFYPCVTNNLRFIAFNRLTSQVSNLADNTVFQALNTFVPPSNYEVTQHVIVDNNQETGHHFATSGSLIYTTFPQTLQLFNDPNGRLLTGFTINAGEIGGTAGGGGVLEININNGPGPTLNYSAVIHINASGYANPNLIANTSELYILCTQLNLSLTQNNPGAIASVVLSINYKWV